MKLDRLYQIFNIKYNKMKVVFLKNHGIIERDELKDLAPEIAAHLISKGIVKKYEPTNKRKQSKKQ